MIDLERRSRRSPDESGIVEERVSSDIVLYIRRVRNVAEIVAVRGSGKRRKNEQDGERRDEERPGNAAPNASRRRIAARRPRKSTQTPTLESRKFETTSRLPRSSLKPNSTPALNMTVECILDVEFDDISPRPGR